MTYRQARWEEPSIWDVAHAHAPEPAPAIPGSPSGSGGAPS